MKFYFKRSLLSGVLITAFGSSVFADDTCPKKESFDVDYFVNLSLYTADEHIKHANKSQSSSHNKEFAFGINPVVSIDDVTLEYDGMYGENRTNFGPISGKMAIYEYPERDNEKFNFGKIRQILKKSYDDRKFKHGYARASYNDISNNRKIVIGDVSPSVTFGNMQGISGLGFAVTSYNGIYDFSAKKKVNSQSAIVLMYPSKVEVKHNGCIIQISFYAPGIYSVFDLVPEARAGDGYEIKITDPMNRSYSVYMDLYGDKEVLPENKDEYEFLMVLPHKFDSLDSFHHSYDSNFLINAVYRWAVTDRITASTSIQNFKNQLVFMLGLNFKTDYGLFAQSLGYSYNGDVCDKKSDKDSKQAFSYEAFYRTPWTPLGKLDILFSIIGKGYSDFGRNKIREDELFKQYILSRKNIENGYNYEEQFTDSQVTHLNIRYSPVKITENVVFAIAYDMVWHEGQKDHSYDLCVDIKQNPRINWAFGVGLTKRDTRNKYIEADHEKEKKKHFCRRFYIALDYKIIDQLKLSSSYDYDNQRTANYSLTYKPKKIKGLELEFNPLFLNGANLSRSLAYKIKYECKYFEAKVDFTNKIKRRGGEHNDKARLFFNTSFSNGKFRKLVKTHYMFTNSLAERKFKEKK